MSSKAGRRGCCASRSLLLLYGAAICAAACLFWASTSLLGGATSPTSPPGPPPDQRPSQELIATQQGQQQAIFKAASERGTGDGPRDGAAQPAAAVAPQQQKGELCKVVVDRPGGIDERYLYERRWVEELTGTCIWTIQECKAAGHCDPKYIISRLHGGSLNKLEKETFGKLRGLKVLLHLSDEARQAKFHEKKRAEYAKWRQVFRFYYDAVYEDMPNVHWVPLGYASTGYDWSRLSAPVVPASQRPFNVCFTGNTGNNGKRGAMVKEFEKATQWKVRGITRSAGFGAGDRNDYVDSMLQSQFCLAPPGSSFETFRLYEALQAGCIPVMLEQWSAGREPGREAEGLRWNNFTEEQRPYLTRLDDVLRGDVDALQASMRERWRWIKAFHSDQIRAAA